MITCKHVFSEKNSLKLFRYESSTEILTFSLLIRVIKRTHIYVFDILEEGLINFDE